MSITVNMSKYTPNIAKAIACDKKWNVYRIYDKDEKKTNWQNMDW